MGGGSGGGSTANRQERVVNAGPVSKYAADGLYDSFRDQGFFLVRKGDRLVALSSYCTHRKCKLTTDPDHSFYCPCHGSTFDPDGRVTEGPAKQDLPTLPSFTNETGELFVRVPNL
jgi:Rieske Fe-S protein